MAQICVYCSSSNGIAPHFFELGREVGRALALDGHTLVYGGGSVGIMGEVARGVHENRGEVFGVMPEALKSREGIAYELADEMVVTDTMQERKAIMFTRAEAFVVLPGGFGTMEEFLEVLTLRLLGYHDKPIVLVNYQGFYDRLIDLFAHFCEEGFAHTSCMSLFEVATTAEETAEAVARALR
jgi:cytokinin riboside 5'-monophosphate phosphoribohydrolase